MKCRVRAVLKRDGKLLLVQHNGHNTWCLPGGGIDDGEDLHSALRREMLEELGVEPVIGRLMAVHQFADNGVMQGPEFFFEVTNVDDFLNVDPSVTSHGPAEISHVEWRDPHHTDNLRPPFLADLLTSTGVLVVLP